jgi:hypothetical protein
VIGADFVTGRADVIGAACDSMIGVGVATTGVSTTTGASTTFFSPKPKKFLIDFHIIMFYFFVIYNE